MAGYKFTMVKFKKAKALGTLVRIPIWSQLEPKKKMTIATATATAQHRNFPSIYCLKISLIKYPLFVLFS